VSFGSPTKAIQNRIQVNAEYKRLKERGVFKVKNIRRLCKQERDQIDVEQSAAKKAKQGS
jgi:hypothetical protein